MTNEILKVFTAFSGYDSQCMALDRLAPLGLKYDLVGWSEIDKYAIQAHNAVYPQFAERNFGDISKINWEEVPDFDLFTYSFPCQDISAAGVQRGLEEGSGTRSSLLWECRKAIEVKRPKFLLMENVKALTFKKFLPYLEKWEETLREYGYTSWRRVLNAKDYGIPQNRERVFLVSILDGEPDEFEFPESFELTTRLEDVLEENVDESYYLSKKALEGFQKKDEEHFANLTTSAKGGEDVANAIETNEHKMVNNLPKFAVNEPQSLEKAVGGVINLYRINSSQDGVVVSPKGIAPCVTSGHGNTPKILQRNLGPCEEKKTLKKKSNSY